MVRYGGGARLHGRCVMVSHYACGALFAGRSSQLFMSNRAYCPVCKEVIWLVEPPWKPVKGKCVARKQILDHHSPRPMSVSQVCAVSSKALNVNLL